MDARSKRLRAGGEPQEEAILPLPGPRESIQRTRAFRSTWILSSLESLRAAGLFERYSASLREYRDEIFSCVPGAWVPMPVVYAHYSACDALGLSKEEVVALSRGPGSHVRQTWHAAVLAPTRKQDVPTWPTLSKIDAIWRRSADGGAAAVFRLKSAMARVEYVRCELFAIPYFRYAVRAAPVNLVQNFGQRQAVHTLPQPTSDECDYRVEWE